MHWNGDKMLISTCFEIRLERHERDYLNDEDQRDVVT